MVKIDDSALKVEMNSALLAIIVGWYGRGYVIANNKCAIILSDKVAT